MEPSPAPPPLRLIRALLTQEEAAGQGGGRGDGAGFPAGQAGVGGARAHVLPARVSCEHHCSPTFHLSGFPIFWEGGGV